MAKPYYTSQDLINAVKRKISFPIAQNTFSEEEILAFANEEMTINQVPSILQYHEDFFSFEEKIPLVMGQKRYAIPSRAIGMRLKDVHFMDDNENRLELSRIDTSDRAFYNGLTSLSKFYFEGNDMILVVNDVAEAGYLVMSYYFRPNQLVLNNRAAISINYAKVVEVLASGTITIEGIEYTGDINGLSASIPYTTIVSGTNLNIIYKDRSLEFSSDDFDVTNEGLQFDTIPDHLIRGSIVDFIRTSGGHSVLKYDIEMITEPDVFNSIISGPAGIIPDNFKLGDYICEQMECIIPQIPDDLHVALAERTGQQILSSMGDSAGVKDINNKLANIEHRQGTLIDNRAESSPQKVSNRHNHLKYGKRTRNR